MTYSEFTYEDDPQYFQPPVTREELMRLADVTASKASRRVEAELAVPGKAEWLTTSSWTCPACGETVSRPEAYGIPFSGDLPPCRCQREAYRRARDACIGEHRERVAELEWGRSAIPKRFRAVGLDIFKERPGTDAALRACREYASQFKQGDTSTGLLLVGPFGSGKTHLMISTARAIMERHLVRPLYVTATALLQAVKASFATERKSDPAEEAKRAELLLLDDIGQEVGTDFDRATLFAIVDHRYLECRPTLFTSNLGEKQLADRLGGAAVSRFYEMARMVPVKATDYRKEHAKA